MGLMNKKKPESNQELKGNKELTLWLQIISKQLERLIICQEKRLSGEVLKGFDSKKHLEGGF